MNRSDYYNYIEERLLLLSLRVKNRGKLNILDYHIHSENFYRDFLNLLYGWNLTNENAIQQNSEAIDLVDRQNKIIVQVSATNKKTKIDGTLSKLIDNYNGYRLKFVFISEPVEELRTKTYDVPSSIILDPKQDIYDVTRILKEIKDFGIDRQKDVYDLIWKELGNETAITKVSSGLVEVVKLLSQEDLDEVEELSVPNEFEINCKIEFNDLSNCKALISEYNIYQSIVNRIYSEYDKMGQNKSMSVLRKIRRYYLENKNKLAGEALFNHIVKAINTDLKTKINIAMSEETIEECVDIIVVDAFIRCKIFENPK